MEGADHQVFIGRAVGCRHNSHLQNALELEVELHRDGILSCEFFKWLGNCDEEDHKKLIQHILGRSGESRILGYPKVIVK